jgi:hypothetical protein
MYANTVAFLVPGLELRDTNHRDVGPHNGILICAPAPLIEDDRPMH